jgi:hypothetical protein
MEWIFAIYSELCRYPGFAKINMTLEYVMIRGGILLCTKKELRRGDLV